MSKNNHKGKETNGKESFIGSKLKEVKEANLKYNNGKDIEVISRNYNINNLKNGDVSKKASKQMTKVQIEDNNSEKEEEENSDKEQLTNNMKENSPNWNEKNKYLDKIKELQEKIKQMNLEYSNEIKKHKEEVEQKEKDIKKLLITNNNLKNNLEILTQRLDKILINSNQQKMKINKIVNNNINNCNQEELQHKLDIKEKELKNQQQLINILTKDNKNIRNILNNLNNFGINETNINFTEKIQQQYQEIQNLKKDLKDYKIKLEQKQSSTQKNKESKEISFNTDDDNSIKNKQNIFLHKNKKGKINSISSTGSSYNIHKINKNKSQSLELNNKNNQKKKLIYRGINSSFDNNNNTEAIFTNEEITTIKNSFYDEKKYDNFMNKINILEKASISKEKEMKMKIKIIEHKLKQKEKELLELKKESKDKENTIISLNIENKELKKNKEDLINKINFLAKTLNLLDQKNQMITKKNEQIKNSIFNIDGIIEAKSKDGNTIPLLVEKNKNLNIKCSNTNNIQKNGNDSIIQSDKNIYKYTNSDENE